MHGGKKNSASAFYRCVSLFISPFFYAYLQRLRACWEPGQSINVNAGDGARSPLGALALGGAGVNLRAGAHTEDDERQQRARYHLHAGWLQRKK